MAALQPCGRLDVSRADACPSSSSSFHGCPPSFLRGLVRGSIDLSVRDMVNPEPPAFLNRRGRIWRAGNGRIALCTGSPLRVTKLAASLQHAGSTTTCSQQMLQQLQHQMIQASLREDYAEAARIRDTINTLLDTDQALGLRICMDKAIAEERYEDAANYRDQLETLERKPNTELDCYSDTRTQGVRVQVCSVYVSARSQPCKGQYFFAYRIRISNECPRPVKLLSRHWVIMDANGRTESIRGLGVVGEQPVLLPGSDFEYTSACPLGTPTGKMEGDFEMRYLDESSLSTFNVKVGSFGLVVKPAADGASS